MDDIAMVQSCPFDIEKVRADFPVLGKTVHGHPLIYLDNGATTQKPWAVINRIHKFDSGKLKSLEVSRGQRPLFGSDNAGDLHVSHIGSLSLPFVVG